MKLSKPGYYDDFRCLAARCPDSCCQLWDVEIDPDTENLYKTIPGELGKLLRDELYKEDGCTYLRFGADGRCPLWRPDGLCRVQAELGEAALSHVCKTFPRLSHDFGDFEELGLELSCPEAARLILTAGTHDWITSQLPEGDEPDYDHEAMAVLKATRLTAREILTNSAVSPAQALAQLLIYGYQAQGELDGEPIRPFDREKAMEIAAELAQPNDGQALRDFFQGLETMTEEWKERLRQPREILPWGDAHRNLALYFVDRYWLQAVSDYDLVSRVKLAVTSTLLIHLLGGELLRTAQLFSKEVENDADNIDALLDGAYDCPAMTDAQLLGLLLA